MAWMEHSLTGVSQKKSQKLQRCQVKEIERGMKKKKRVGGAVLEALLGGIIIAENQEGATAASSSAWRGSGRCVI